MKTVYFVRHGESEANANNITAGASLDAVLTTHGKNQAVKVGKELKGKKINLIVSSPLKRAHHTAVIIANEIKYDPNAILLSDLFVERELGDMTGQPREAVRIAFDTGTLPGNAESTEAMHDRITKGLEWLKSLEAENIILVSHGGPGRMIRTIFHDEPHTSINSLRRIGNADILELQL